MARGSHRTTVAVRNLGDVDVRRREYDLALEQQVVHGMTLRLGEAAHASEFLAPCIRLGCARTSRRSLRRSIMCSNSRNNSAVERSGS